MWTLGGCLHRSKTTGDLFFTEISRSPVDRCIEHSDLLVMQCAPCHTSHPVTRHTGHNNNKVSRQPTLHTGHPGGLQLVRIHKNYVMSFVGLLQFIPITESQNHFWGCVTCGLCFCFWSKALASFKSFVSNVRNEGSKRLHKVPVCSVELVTALDPPHN